MSLRFLPALLIGVGFVLAGCASQPTAYSSPDQAAAALADAARTGKKDKVIAALGGSAEELATTGDDADDERDIRGFVEAYDKKKELLPQPDGSYVLAVGEDRWPFAAPIVYRDGAWRFDIERGREELINRRIGRNELAAINVCHAIVDAQHEYARVTGGDIPQYARKFVSDEGKQDGLYWKAKEGEPESPLGPLLAAAADEGHDLKAMREGRAPYRGYRYRILTSQGPAAPGGARDYIVADKMIGGFAVLAYPAEYEASGIMSFVTSHDGQIYEADLGPDTAKIALAMKAFDPDPTWTRVQDK